MKGSFRLVLALALMLGFSKGFAAPDFETLYKDHWQDKSESVTDTELVELEKANAQESIHGHAPITAWELLGDRFAVGKDAKGNRVAVYDLSYPRLFGAKSFAGTLLGSIGFGNFNLKTLIEAILGTFSSQPTKSEKKTIEALKYVQEKFGSTTNAAPENWWKTIVWKAHAEQLANRETAPEVFRLGDMDLAAMAKNKDKFEKAVENMNSKLSEATGFDFGPDFFSLFELRKNASSGYDIHFLDQDLKQKDKMFMLVDLENYTSSYRRGLKIFLVGEAFKQAVKFIPIPFAAQLLGAVTSRWFSLYKLQIRQHEDALLELVNNAELGDKFSPAIAFSPEERFRVGTYISDFALSKMSLFSRLFKSKKVAWKKTLTSDLNEQIGSKAWLSEHNFNSATFGPWYSRGTRAKDENKIFVLSEQHLFTKRPIIAVDYDHPEYEIIKRNVIEAGDFALEFISIPVPFAGTLLDSVYSYLLTKPVGRAKGWEARLASYGLNEGEPGLWNDEVRMLYERRMNPFELDRKAELELVTKRRKALGI